MVAAAKLPDTSVSDEQFEKLLGRIEAKLTALSEERLKIGLALILQNSPELKSIRFDRTPPTEKKKP
jgi:hypothetical protein